MLDTLYAIGLYGIAIIFPPLAILICWKRFPNDCERSTLLSGTLLLGNARGDRSQLPPSRAAICKKND